MVIDSDLLFLIKDFFLSEKKEYLDKYSLNSSIGNIEKSKEYMYKIMQIIEYEKYLTEKYPAITLDEFLACLESCNFLLIKLRKFLESLKGVNIDIIEDTQIVY